MWPWQRNGEQPSRTLIRRLLALSSLGHACLLVFIFVLYHDDATRVSRDVIAVLLDTDVTIVKVPMSKVINKKVPVVGSGTKAASTAGAKAVKAPAIKAAPPATAVVSKPVAKIPAAKTQAKSKPKVVPKKETPKPKVPATKVEPKKVEVKKTEPKPEPKPEPKIEPKKEEIKKEAIEEVTPIQEDVNVQEQASDGDNVVHVGWQEYEALEVQRQIQQEAERCWKAPSGIAADVSCEIIVRVGHDGTLHSINVAQQSGILMYDVQARQAVAQMEFPRGSWGKEVVVYFKQ